MIDKVMIGIVLLVLTLILAHFSPWITEDFAEQRAINEFEQEWENVSDGCSISCDGCGAVESHDVPYGYQVTLEYACGFAEQGVGHHETETFFVSFIGTVH